MRRAPSIFATNRRRQKRTPEQQLALAVRILDNQHDDDVAERIEAGLGERADVVGEPDLSRNTLLTYSTRFQEAWIPQPLVTGVDERLANIIGDFSGLQTVADYAAVDGGRPLPTALLSSGMEAARYEVGAGLGAVLIGVPNLSPTLAYEVIAPDLVEPVYSTDDPLEPTEIKHRGERVIDGKAVETVDWYDLSDPAQPSYTIWAGDEDVTFKATGRTYVGADYPWRYADGTPFHRIVVTGHPRHIYRAKTLVETTLTVAMHWTAWGAGVLDGGYPQRHVMGLYIVGGGSDGDERSTSYATGPETVVQWANVDPERPGTHWQDAPGYDPEAMARAIRTYESSGLSEMGINVDFEGTGGEPAKREAESFARRIGLTYPEIRRFVGELIRRSAATANRFGLGPVVEPSRTEIGVMLGDEITRALAPPPVADPSDTTEQDHTDARADQAT